MIKKKLNDIKNNRAIWKSFTLLKNMNFVNYSTTEQKFKHYWNKLIIANI